MKLYAVIPYCSFLDKSIIDATDHKESCLFSFFCFLYDSLSQLSSQNWIRKVCLLPFPCQSTSEQHIEVSCG